MKKLFAFLTVLLVMSVFLFLGCEKHNDDVETQYKVYAFDGFCKYNLDLIEDVTLKNIAVPLVTNYITNKDGQFEFAKITGENIDGIDIVFIKRESMLTYYNNNISVMIFEIKTNDNYSTQEIISINKFIFKLKEDEYKVPVDITLKVNPNDGGSNKHYIELDVLNQDNRIEIESFEQELNTNFIITDIISPNDIFDITLEKCKQYITEVNQGYEMTYKEAHDFQELERAYVNDYDYYDLIINNKNNAFCGGDMIYFELEDENTNQKENALCGAVTYVDIAIIINLLSENLDINQ